MTTCEDCGRSVDDGDSDTARCGPCRRLRDRDISVAPMSDDDLELVLAWRCNPEIYRYFRGQAEPLSWDDHVAWFESRTPERFDFVVSFEGRRVGIVSLDADDEVSVYLGDVAARGHGVATAAVEWLCDRFTDRTPIYAEVHRDNDSSKRLFERCGFERLPDKREDDDGAWLRYVYDA